MDKYKIIALFGPAGSGKDYIQKHIMETSWGKSHLHPIISCTTRPPRQGEQDGVDYYFLKTAGQLLAKDLIEFSVFRDWWYGTTINNLNQNKINIGVFNIQGVNTLINKDYIHRIDCLPIYIKTYDKIRLLRQLEREANPDCLEICRRFQTDIYDFKKILFEYKIIENNTNEFYPIMQDIIHFCQEKWTKTLN